MASRHLSRMSVLQALFTADLRLPTEEVGGSISADVHTLLIENTTSLPKDDEDVVFSANLLKGIVAKQKDIDVVIQKAAPQWPIEKIAPIDRNILRIGLYELLFAENKSVPPKVALNEAIELAKTFGGDSSGRFVNGVLGSVYRSIGSPQKDEAPRVRSREKEYSAGVVVCAVEGKTVWVALVRDPFDTWTLPKVQYEKGELSDSAAKRAAKDELGVEITELKAPIAENEYQAHDPKQGAVTRRVAYFVACTDRQPLSSKKGSNIKEARWFGEGELKDLTMYEDLRSILESGILVSKEGCV